MALLSIYRGTQAEVSERSVSDGALLFATDTKKIYLDQGSSRIEMTSLQDLSDYVTSTQLSSTIEAEASARQKQDNLLQDDIDTKMQVDDLVEGNNVTLDMTSQAGKVVVSAVNTNTTYTLSKSGSTITLIGSDGSSTQVTDSDTNTTYSLASTTANGLLRQLSGSTSQFMRGDGTWATPTATIADGSITTAKLATDAVTSAKIATNAVTADGIAAGAVGTSELAANAVTLAKLGSDVGTVAVQSSTPSDTNVKLWIQI